MIKGVHTMFYGSDPEALRAFLRDKLGLPWSDVGDGWLIFDLPEADMGCHPAAQGGTHGAPAGTHDISFYCDDIRRTVAELRSRGVAFTGEVEDHGFGLVTHLDMPGGVRAKLYQPLYEKEDRRGGPPDPRLAEVIKALDPPTGVRPWHGGAGVLGCLRGVSAEAAAWKPAPDRHSIWELALHTAYWKYAVRRSLTGEEEGGFPRSPANWPAVPDPADAEAWARDRRLLRDEHRRLLEAIRAFDPARLDEKPEKGEWTFMERLTGIVQHDMYHTGQVQIMKRIHASLVG